MNKLSVCVLLFLCCAVFSSPPIAAQNKPVLEIMIRVIDEKNTNAFAIGEPKRFHVEIKNISSLPIQINVTRGDTLAEDLFQAQLLTQSGVPVMRRSDSRNSLDGSQANHRRIEGRARPVFLEPSDTIQRDVDLDKLFVINDPGVYSLQVKMFDSASQSFVKSNVLPLAISAN